MRLLHRAQPRQMAATHPSSTCAYGQYAGRINMKRKHEGHHLCEAASVPPVCSKLTMHANFQDGTRSEIDVTLETTVHTLKELLSVKTGRQVIALFEEASEDELHDARSVGGLGLSADHALFAREDDGIAVVVSEIFEGRIANSDLEELCTSQGFKIHTLMFDGSQDTIDATHLPTQALMCLSKLQRLRDLTIRSCQQFGPPLGLVCAAVVKECKLLVSLNISNNRLCGIDEREPGSQREQRVQGWPEYDGSGLLALCQALADNSTVTHLDVSANALQSEGTQQVAQLLQKNTKLSKLTFGDPFVYCHHAHHGMLHDRRQPSDPIVMDAAMADADFHGRNLDPQAFVIMAAFLPRCKAITALDISDNDMCGLGSDSEGVFCDDSGLASIMNALANSNLSSVNLLSNFIPSKQADELINMMESHGSLKTLCGGIGGDVTELDMHVPKDNSGPRLAAGCLCLMCNELKDHRSLASLNISNNMMGYEVEPGQSRDSSTGGSEAIAWLLEESRSLTALDISHNHTYSCLHFIAAPLKMNGSLCKLTFGDESEITMDRSMTDLCLEFCHGVHNLELEVLSAFLPKCANLTKLSLSGCKIFDDDDMAMHEEFGPALATSRSITELDLSDNGLGIGQLHSALIKALQTNSTLTKLVVSDNGFSEQKQSEIQQICDSKSIACTL